MRVSISIFNPVKDTVPQEPSIAGATRHSSLRSLLNQPDRAAGRAPCAPLELRACTDAAARTNHP
eukprot:10303466-Alexandrium_andersonii.AAC.1